MTIYFFSIVIQSNCRLAAGYSGFRGTRWHFNILWVLVPIYGLTGTRIHAGTCFLVGTGFLVETTFLIGTEILTGTGILAGTRFLVGT